MFFCGMLIILVLPKKKNGKNRRGTTGRGPRKRRRASKETKTMSNSKQESAKKLALTYAQRVRAISLQWLKEVDEEATAIQVADNIALSTFQFLTGNKDAAKTLKALVEDNFSPEQIAELHDLIKEGLQEVRDALRDSEQEKREQQAKAQEEAREKARQEREAKRAKAEQECKAKKARAKAAADAIRDFRSENYTAISFLDATIGDYIRFHSVDGYADTYEILDVSNTTLYVVNGYDSAGRAQYISVKLSQFEYKADGTVTFADAYDASNVAEVKCYRKAG